MIYRFDNIIDSDSILRLTETKADSMGIEDILCLVVSESASLDMIGAVSKIDLHSMVNAVFISIFFFRKEYFF